MTSPVNVDVKLGVNKFNVWSAAPVAFWGWGRRWNSGNTRAAPLVWSSVTADVGLIRNAVLTLIAKKQE